MTTPVLASYLLAAIALLLVLKAGFLVALFSGLLVFSLVHIMVPTIQKKYTSKQARLIAVIVLSTIVIVTVSLGIWGAIVFFRSDAGSLSMLLQKLADIIATSHSQIPDWARSYFPEDVDALGKILTNGLLDHAVISAHESVQRTPQLLKILRDAGVMSALIHGGTSTVFAIGAPPDSDAWRIAIEAPTAPAVRSPAFTRSPEPPEGGTTNLPLATIPLHDESLSVSAVSGKCFVANGRTLGHVIDPRTGEPVSRALLSAVVLPSATETDALSTALLVAGPDAHDTIAALRPDMRTLVVTAGGENNLHLVTRGIERHPTSAG